MQCDGVCLHPLPTAGMRGTCCSLAAGHPLGKQISHSMCSWRRCPLLRANARPDHTLAVNLQAHPPEQQSWSKSKHNFLARPQAESRQAVCPQSSARTSGTRHSRVLWSILALESSVEALILVSSIPPTSAGLTFSSSLVSRGNST